MNTIREGKSYIDKVEAFEIMLERGIEKLPRKGIVFRFDIRKPFGLEFRS
jgi:hypothetical protein